MITVNDLISARGAYYYFHIFGGALISKFSKIGIQIFHMRFKIKYHPSIFKRYRFFTLINIQIKKITERYRYFEFSSEQDTISKPDLKKRDTQKPNDMTRTNIKEDICHLDFVFVYRYAFYQCIK